MLSLNTMTAFYLTYRPQKISDLDLKTVRELLEEILGSKNILHAFLFVGPKGTGKTSSARIVAKSLNCVGKKKNKGEPCNKCEMCKSISQARAIDLIEIDAASNRGIDDIRSLREKIKLTPGQAKKKIYIIDEVHMLTNEAFNALLKTLEEPPDHAVFVLCTTEPHKLPETIVSRCWQVDFSKATVEEVVRSLKKVVKGEKIKITDKDLKLIASQVDGSFRDGVKILEQLSSGGKKISSKKVKQWSEQGIGELNIDEWLVMVYKGEKEKVLKDLNKAVNKGMDVSKFIIKILEKLRQVLLKKWSVEIEGEDIVELKDVNKIRNLARLFDKAGQEVRYSMIEILPLELAVMEWAGGEVDSDEDFEEETGKETVDLKTDKSKIKYSKNQGKLNIKQVEDRWTEVLAAMKPHNHSLEALLKATKPTGFDGKFLMLEVFYKFHKERLETDRYRQIVEEVASQVLSAPVSIRYCLGERIQPVKKPAVDSSNVNIPTKVDNDIINTAEEVFGVKVE